MILKLQHTLEREKILILGNYLPEDAVRLRLGKISKATQHLYKHNLPQKH